ncbi:hypothetical protein BX589_101112 [Paraburkholderia fungorum]|jgi:hypothetical protein|uniref:hypothetical protein n=1 Tax=Paraburkholderia fungorum TaxID=134537 RepID=UPI000D410E5F|nr:hypothetical protein [Paraburkholderia fungorum]PRZ56462.1 hypothetical protein BX589_101112 [Paraburkholderia fungorum]
MNSTAHDPLDASNSQSPSDAEAPSVSKQRVRGGRLFLQVPDYVKPALRGLIASFASFASPAALGRNAQQGVGRPITSERMLADHLLRQVAKLTAPQVAKMPVSNFSRGAMGAANERIPLSCDKQLFAEASANAQRLGATLQDCVRALALSMARKSASAADAQAIDRFIRAHTRPAAIALSENGVVKGIAPIAHEVVFCKSNFRQRFRERCAALGVYEKAAYAEALAGFARSIHEGAALDAGEQPPFAPAAEASVAATVSRLIEGVHERAPSGAKAWNLYADRAVFDDLFELARTANVSRARVMRAALLRWLESDAHARLPEATTAVAPTSLPAQGPAGAPVELPTSARVEAPATPAPATRAIAARTSASNVSQPVARNHSGFASEPQRARPAGAWKPQQSQRGAMGGEALDPAPTVRDARAAASKTDAASRKWLSPADILGEAVASIPAPAFRDAPDWDDSDDADPIGESWKASTAAAGAGWGAQ